MRAPKSTIVAITIAFAALAAQAEGIFVVDLGTESPPDMVGPYVMTPFPADPQALYVEVDSVESPLGGYVTLQPSAMHASVGDGWTTWSHGYSGDVYYPLLWSGSGWELHIGLPVNTGAFYFYAEPALLEGWYAITATAQDGCSLTVPVYGDMGASGYGFYSTLSPIVSIIVSSTAHFAVGEFGIATLVAQPQVRLANGAGCYFLSDDTQGDPGVRFRLLAQWDQKQEAYDGDVRVEYKDRWRVDGLVTDCVQTSSFVGQASGRATVFWWDAGAEKGPGGWVPLASDVGYIVSFVDADQSPPNKGKGAMPDSFALTFLDLGPIDASILEAVGPPPVSEAPEMLKSGHVNIHVE